MSVCSIPVYEKICHNSFYNSPSQCLGQTADHICESYNYHANAFISAQPGSSFTKRTDISSRLPFCRSGSMTVEAALVLPVFLMVLAGFLFYFQLLSLQLRLAGGLETAGQQIAEIYHLENVLPDIFSGEQPADEDSVSRQLREYAGKLAFSGLTGAYVKYTILDYVGEDFLNGSCIKNGSDGLLCYALTEGGMLELRASYEVSIPFLPEKSFSIPVTQRLVRRMWVGIAADIGEHGETQEEQAEKAAVRTVYVTRYGTVYHLYQDCQSLKRSIRSCTYASIGDRKNEEGAHYTACKQCIHGSVNAIVYVTAEGQKYHNSISCGALLRYIEAVPLDEVDGKVLCSYCKARQEEQNGTVE